MTNIPMRYGLLALLVGLMVSITTLAQVTDETRTPPLEMPFYDNGEWSTDSQWFTFVNYQDLVTFADDYSLAVTFKSPSWIAYNPETHRYVSDTTWWLQPELSAAEQDIFATDDLIRTSPDGELLLFSKPDENGHWEYHLANRTTQEIISLDISARLFNFSAFYPIYWSEDGNQLALSTVELVYSGAPFFWYINILDRDDLQSTDVTLFELHSPLGHDFRTGAASVARLFDMSADGTQAVLISEDFSDLTLPRLPHFLIVWKPDAPDESVIIDAYPPRELSSVAFAPHDETQLLILLRNGELWLYDFETEEQIQLAVFEEPYFSYFSPDGRWLAFDRGLIDFIEIEPLLVQANQLSIDEITPRKG